MAIGPASGVATNGNETTRRRDDETTRRRDDETTRLGRSRRSVCAPLVLEGGVRLRVDEWGLCYVRAKNLKWSNDDTKVLAV